MPKLLVVEVSPRSVHSLSRGLTARFVRRWCDANADGDVLVRDLATTSLPYIDLAWIMGAFSPPEIHSPESVAAMKISDALVEELRSSDFILIGTPMHNLNIPASLKAYVDHVVRIGVTVSPQNEGLLTGKRAAVLLASGGDFSSGAAYEKLNHATPYLRAILGFIGIMDLQVVHAGPTGPVMEGRAQADAFLDRFEPDIAQIVNSWRPGVSAESETA